MVDCRALGWEPIRGPEGVVDFWRSWVEIAPEARLWFETLDGDDEHSATLCGGHGHAAAAAGGGVMEYVGTIVSTIRDGRVARSEYFDADEQEAALALLAEWMDG